MEKEGKNEEIRSMSGDEEMKEEKMEDNIRIIVKMRVEERMLIKRI